MIALKAQWVVRAGMIPGEEDEQHRRVWSYTSKDFSDDGNKRGACFFKLNTRCDEYATALREGAPNWVTTEFMWM